LGIARRLQLRWLARPRWLGRFACTQCIDEGYRYNRHTYVSQWRNYKFTPSNAKVAKHGHMHTQHMLIAVLFTTNGRKVIANIRYIINKKHLKNVGPIRHCEPPHAACFTLPFTRSRYCRTPPVHRCPRQRRRRQNDNA